MKRLLLATAMVAGLSAPAWALDPDSEPDLQSWEMMGATIGLSEICGLLPEAQVEAGSSLAMTRQLEAFAFSHPGTDFPAFLAKKLTKAEGDAFVDGIDTANEEYGNGADQGACDHLDAALIYLTMYGHHGYY